MDNQETIAQNSELPKPTVDTSPNTDHASMEQGSNSEEASAGGPTASVATGQTPDPLVTAAASSPHVAGASAHTSALSAEDADLIEKEWVLKAKLIVSQTHGDPYTQNNEINKMKADYIKKRYNKDIKLTSE